MRINLVTPFAEKDQVKALGARWDAAKRIWYITNVADLTPFLRWIPEAGKIPTIPVEGSKRPPTPTKTPSAKETQRSETSTGPTLAAQVPHCGCDVLPWEHCKHTEG
ncbi:MAG: DUF5710 domain-containing protein [Pseudomonadota bacterium]